jgi:L-iditol 2-dehydrogenase
MLTMKAMVLDAPNEVTLQNIDKPAIEGDTLVRVSHSGICGTDLSIYKGGIPVQYPRVMGHEMVGEIVDTGDGEVNPKGTRVIADPVYYCGRCYQCRDGQQQLCTNGGLIGRDRNGGFAEYLSIPSVNVFPLPDEVSNAEAPLIQVLTTCLHAHRLTQIFPGDAVVVIGLGVTGQLHIQLAKARGAYPIIGITRSRWKRELAETLGADITFAPDENTKQKVLDATDGIGADLVIESAGAVPAFAQAIDLVRSGGRVMPFGTYTAKEGEFSFYDLYFKEIEIINARAAKGQDFPTCIDLVKRGVINLAPLITHNLSLGDLGDALSMLKSGEGKQMKIVLDHS